MGANAGEEGGQSLLNQGAIITELMCSMNYKVVLKADLEEELQKTS